ncbi:GvpL/GvpF family gas vesicle protein [Streptomyces alanosinicus]|uniref:Gas vesicle protein n=1 Tax=Streptomyces alanosinicus TaxID=68171 RepID=A0A918YJL5_9ACTN|nr:GvpL/GvpF family gas vesicle protein [Streptomyces alanosinicus]GHE05501.1 gas vesicle protein [Streptomyces alanosinicus]
MTGPRYVYAVCRPFGTPLQAELRGVGGAQPALLRHHDLIAVVSTVPVADCCEEALRAHLADQDWLAATARAHEGVIDALTTVTTPLPLRPGIVFQDDWSVRMMIEAREDEFGRTLDRLEGRVEWGVKLYLEPEPEPEPEPAEPGPARAEAFARSLHELLSRYAEDCRLHTPQPPGPAAVPGPNVFDAAYLVPRAHSEEFVELVDRARQEATGIRVELTGPWAAYSFTGEEVVS